jgi:hypothetical protein
MKENGGGVNSCMIYLIHCKNQCKYHNVPPPITTIKKFKYHGKVDITSINMPNSNILSSILPCMLTVKQKYIVLLLTDLLKLKK